mgnify:CR=1 FL=1
MKSISIAAQSIALGDNNIVVAGGMENMSMSPHYLNLRRGGKFGETRLNDVMEIDGLMDPFHNKLMCVYAEATAKKYGISRNEQDNYCKESYLKSQNAWEKGFFNKEISDFNSSLILSKINTLASTAIPTVKIIPAIPGRVKVASKIVRTPVNINKFAIRAVFAINPKILYL